VFVVVLISCGVEVFYLVDLLREVLVVFEVWCDMIEYALILLYVGDWLVLWVWVLFNDLDEVEFVEVFIVGLWHDELSVCCLMQWFGVVSLFALFEDFVIDSLFNLLFICDFLVWIGL